MRKFLRYTFFVLFSLFYLLTSSRLEVPFITVLRWVGSGVLFISAIIYNYLADRSVDVFPQKSYIFLLIALIPTFLGLAEEATLYSFERIFSLFLVLYGLELFFDLPCWNDKSYVNLISILTFLAGLCMLYSAINPNIMNDRMTGFYMNANFLSCIALFTLTMSLSLFCYNKNLFLKIFWLAIMALSFYCIIMSGSRTGFFALLALLFMIPILLQKKISIKGVILLVLGYVVIVSAVVYVLDNYNISAVERILLFKNSGGTFSRGEAWKDVLNIFYEKPIFGWGYGGISYKVFVEANNDYMWGVHSSYFMILCEMGIFGSTFFLLFFIGYFGNIFKNYHGAKNKMSFNQTLFVRFTILNSFIILINAYSESFLFSLGNPMSICFWCPLIFIFNYLRKMKQSEVPKVTMLGR